MAASILHQLTCVLLLLRVTSGRPSPSSEGKEVNLNLTVTSYNLNTTLRWDYNRKEITPYFSVEILNILKMKWRVLTNCQNISHHFCDVSNEIKDPLTLYKFRVKALVGPNISISETKDVMLSSVGIFCPSHLKVYTEEKMIVVDVFHPEVPSAYDLESIYYIVYFGNDSKEATDCDKSACTATFPASLEARDLDCYCFSAQAKSNHFLMTMERSKEFCIPVTEESSKQPVAIIIVATVFGFLLILAIFCFIITRCTKARSMMPQSLSSVVRNILPNAQMPAQQTTNYDKVDTFPIESPVDKKPCMDENEKVDTDMSTDSASKEGSDPGYHTSEATENEEKMEESEADPFNSSSYFHTDSSTNGIDSRDTPEPEKEENISEPEPAPKPPKPNSFGYDKPHCPKEFIC